MHFEKTFTYGESRDVRRSFMRNTQLILFRSCGYLALVLALLGSSVGICLAQDILTKGAITGTVIDQSEAVIPGAQVTISGQIDKRTVTTDTEGRFDAPNLLPGNYVIKVDAQGFKSLTINNLLVNVGRTLVIKAKMEVGTLAEAVTVEAGAEAVDLSSTATSASLSNQLFENIPLQRSVTSLFYLAPGSTDGLGGGTANPSVSGGSALDNMYVADGVNITDSAFGGFGVFTRSYGSLGVGITTSYVQEVQVKTSGFEPQFGQSEGGIVNIITKSGTDKYHGEVFGYAQPQSFEAERYQRDTYAINKRGELLHPENYDMGVDLGGPVPGMKKRLFFFGSFNPTINRNIVEGAAGGGLQKLLGQTAERSFSKNYAARIDYNLSSKHQFNLSIFGDPTSTNQAPWAQIDPVLFNLSYDNLTGDSKLNYGTRSMAARYSGTLSPTWTLNASISWGHNHFNETGYGDFNQITDRTQAARGNFIAVGRGFVEPTVDNTYRTGWDTQKIVKFMGSHTLGFGYSYQRAYYDGTRSYSGPSFTIPTTNADGTLTMSSIAVGRTTNAEWSLRLAPSTCTLCPFMNVPGTGLVPVYLRQDRGEFGVPAFNTRSNYHAAYAQDTWQINKYVSILAGYRWEQEQMIGTPIPSGPRAHYTFTDNWSPRVGLTIDPIGHGTTKVFYNFGRFTEYFPLDVGERSLSREEDFTGARVAPDYTIVNGQKIVTINQYGTVNPVMDAAHLLNRAAGGIDAGITVSINAFNPILPGTKLGYAQEHSFGVEQQLPKGFVLSVRYIDRRLERIIEDAAVVPPEGADFFGQTYFLGNISAKLDAAVNPIEYKYAANTAGPGGTNNPLVGMPAQCDPTLATAVYGRAPNAPPLGNACFATLGANGKPAGDPGADGVPDGFVNPVHIYRAVEIELNKRFSNNWQMLANWRIASLRGNYEGHLRNDNGQTDPGISSLFDFTQGLYNLLGDQFAVGPLNSDRRHVVNIFTNYSVSSSLTRDHLRFLNGLNLGTGIHVESGLPMSNLAAHPIYLNAGEIPLGGRGALGRTPTDYRIDLHADYPFKISEHTKLAMIADVFNITNARTLRMINQFSESTFQQPNPDFKQPISWYNPISVRLGMKLSF